MASIEIEPDIGDQPNNEMNFLSELNQQLLYNTIMREIKASELPIYDIHPDKVGEIMRNISMNTETDDIVELNEIAINTLLETIGLSKPDELDEAAVQEEKEQLNAMSLFMQSAAAPVEFAIERQPLNPIANPLVSASVVRNESGFSVFSGDRNLDTENLFAFQIRFGTDPDAPGVNFAYTIENVISLSIERMLTPKWGFVCNYAGVVEVVLSSDNFVTKYQTSGQTKDVLAALYPDGYVPRPHRHLIKYGRGSAPNYTLQAPIDLQTLQYRLNFVEPDISYSRNDSPDIAPISVTFRPFGEHHQACFTIPPAYREDFLQDDQVKFLNCDMDYDIFKKIYTLEVDETFEACITIKNLDLALTIMTEPLNISLYNLNLQYYLFFKVVTLENSPVWQQSGFKLES